jgi:undecaprenyl-diphosphatase
MNWIHAVIFGAVEGITEFLPVSSTGHLILTARLLGLPQTETMKSFEIAIQVGAILAVLWIYWRSFLMEWETLKRVIVAFLPTAVIGLLLYRLIKKFLFAGEATVLWALGAGGIILILFDLLYRGKKNATNEIARISFGKAFGIGIIQSLAVIPGVSRSAATILGALALGIERKKAVEFSFLLAVPTLLAATVLDLLKSNSAIAPHDWAMLFVGGFTSFIVAIFSIRFF